LVLLFAGLRALRARDASGMLLATGVASTLISICFALGLLQSVAVRAGAEARPRL